MQPAVSMAYNLCRMSSLKAESCCNMAASSPSCSTIDVRLTFQLLLDQTTVELNSSAIDENIRGQWDALRHTLKLCNDWSSSSMRHAELNSLTTLHPKALTCCLPAHVDVTDKFRLWQQLWQDIAMDRTDMFAMIGHWILQDQVVCKGTPE